MLRTAATSSTKRAAAGARDLPRASRFSFVHVVEDGPAAEGCWSVFLYLYPRVELRVAGSVSFVISLRPSVVEDPLGAGAMHDFAAVTRFFFGKLHIFVTSFFLRGTSVTLFCEK